MNPDLYSDFEEAFRGPRSEILTRLSGYDGLLAECSKSPRARALDLGCGRGEWLELLNRQGFESIGIDSNPYFVEQCQARDLQVVCEDAFAYLPSIPDHTYNLVSAFHLIEHLSHSQIGLLFSEARRVLMPEGLLLLETPSIDNLLVASKSFYCDPTHITPIHPEALCFSLEQAGFAWATAIYINGGIEAQSNHDQITRVFNGVAQDVCILASPLMPNVAFREGLRWQSRMHRAPTTLEALYQYDKESTSRIQNLTSITLELKATIQRLEILVEINNDRTILIESLIGRVRSKLRPLLFVKRQLRRLLAAVRKPRAVLIKIIYATGLTSRRNRPMLLAMLKRFGLHHVSMLMYRRVFSVTPASQSCQLPPALRQVCVVRTQQIEADLAGLGRVKREEFQ